MSEPVEQQISRVQPVWILTGAFVTGFVLVLLGVFQGQFLWVAYQHGGL